MTIKQPAEQLRQTALEIAEKAEELLGELERMTSFDLVITLKPFEVPTYTVKKTYMSESVFQEKEEEKFNTWEVRDGITGKVIYEYKEKEKE
jgi:hypothetical protein